MLNKKPSDENALLIDALHQLEFFSALSGVSKFARSEQGREAILELLPMEELYLLRKEHSLVGEMVELFITDDPVPFENMSDIRPKLYKTRIQGAALSAPDLLNLKDVFRLCRLIKNYFSARAEKYPVLSENCSNLHENKVLEKHIEDAIDDTGEVRDNASRELSRIRREIRDKSNRLRNYLQKILRRVTEEELVTDEFVTIREGRFVLPVKSEHKRHLPGIIHGVSQTGSTVFLEPSEIVEMNNDLSLLLNEEKREIYRILSDLTSEIGDDSESFLRSVEILAHIDTIMAKAGYALEYGGIKPEITDENIIYLKDIRHPLLVKAKGKEKVMPLSVEFSSDKRGHLISGPNAGGKTVALKSIGLNIALALSGIFPLGVCKTNIRRIFSSIGDRQSIENDLSTFSSQIIQLKEILSYCTADSLVLIDEIGSGTDPQEGGALAAGVLDTLLEQRAFFVATTHQSSLKTYALNRSEIVNASLEFDEKNLKPTYRFLSGIPGNSYAFVLAKSIGLSRLVLERAEKYMGSRHSELEESISALQKVKFEAEELRMKAEEEKNKAENSKNHYNSMLKDVKERRKQILQDAQREALEIVRNANSLIEKTILEIRKQEKPFVEIKQQFAEKKEQIEKAAQKLLPKKRNPKNKVSEFEVGNTVSVEETNAFGEILEIDINSKTALVDLNGIKFRLSLDKLQKAENKVEIKKQFSEFIKYDAKSRIDLRGMRADEAIRETDEFIQNAIVGNIQLLTIIHGKGTGALRGAIHDFLSTHPSVISYRLGELVEGGAGVTIVVL